MDDLRFVHESPQSHQGHRKRPRLVTACDNCRVKKIRCVKRSTNDRCEACTTANVACQFRDRERYFAERSRLIAGSSVVTPVSAGRKSAVASTSPRMHSRNFHRPNDSPPSSLHSSYSAPSPRTTFSSSSQAEDEFFGYHGRRSSEPPEFHHPLSTDHRFVSFILVRLASPLSYDPTDPDSWDYPADLHVLSPEHSRTSDLVQQPDSAASVSLFDATHPHYPNYTLMPHFIHKFFDNMGSECPFLSNEDVIRRFLDQALPPLLANCIAALASRFSDLPQLTTQGLPNVAESYCSNAKNILSPIMHVPALDSLHALILIAMSEFKSNRASGFRAYSEMAVRMAFDIGLSDSQSIQMTTSGRERSKLQATWSTAWQLHMSASNRKL
ncbi:hypothetical protein JAAARDRAFT_143529 [Jaapia argillacea MUCL 33604]|uniref:Zn(2)-C6 fungal-type domain-containing protein n=1 Tax=Jaapia argillacea MUCL 33604 TaxID=933084 RepID=A0A067P6B8_9AGAM|nr:hypothetical protein JAAARDRAFT_143529 [Jaapia argillacea MUCL 33604]